MQKTIQKVAKCRKCVNGTDIYAGSKGGKRMKKINIGETRGIVRKVDGLGRIVIPIEFRKMLGIEINDPVEIFMIRDGLYIKKG